METLRPAFASVSGADVVFDFGCGDTVTLLGIGSTVDLANDLIIACGANPENGNGRARDAPGRFKCEDGVRDLPRGFFSTVD